MDILIGKSKLIKVGSMVLVAVFIIICYQLDVGASTGNSNLLSAYLTYSGKIRIKILDQESTGSIEDCHGDYFCDVVKQAPVYGGIDLAIAIIVILIELLEKPVLKDKIKPDLLKNIIFISLLIGFGFALATMLQFWFASGSKDWKLQAGTIKQNNFINQQIQILANDNLMQFIEELNPLQSNLNCPLQSIVWIQQFCVIQGEIIANTRHFIELMINILSDLILKFFFSNQCQIRISLYIVFFLVHNQQLNQIKLIMVLL